MVEVRDISVSETPPNDADWLLVEPTGNKFIVNGAASGTKGATFFTPPPFDSLDEAVAAAVAWAGQNDVPVVYVRAS